MPAMAPSTPRDNSKINLGDRAKDVITSLIGIVIAKTYWINGCVRVVLQPEKLKSDGSMHDPVTIDIEQVIVIKPKIHKPSSPHGGPCNDKVAQRR